MTKLIRCIKRCVGIFVAAAMIFQIISFSVIAAAEQQREYIAPFAGKTPKIFLAGDSTCENLAENYFPREGWGMEIGKFFDKSVKIVNMAKGGKSTRSFLNNWDAPSGVYDTRLSDIEKNSSKGDWLFVQFGHNDYNNFREGVPTDPDKPTDNGDKTSYRQNLQRFVEFAEKNKLNLVFLTSIHVLTSFSDGNLNSDGIDGFRNAMKEVGQANGVPVLDIGGEHKKLIENLGEENAKSIFMFVSREDYPNLPESVNTSDTTHINAVGATEVSKIVVNEIKKGAASGNALLSELYSLVDTNADLTPIHSENNSNNKNDENNNTPKSDNTAEIEPGKNNAYVVFGEEIKTSHMKFNDGLSQGVTASSDPLYSEKVELGGVYSRKMYAQNIAYMNLEKSYYQPGDRRFLVMITYYDFGPDVGYFYFDYNSCDPTLDEEARAKKRITITKPGITPQWSTARLYIDDADFSGKQPYGADMSLVTRTYNAWAMVEIVNIDAMERNNSTDSVPVVNAVQAGGLEQLGLYSSHNADGNKNELTSQFTKIEALRMTLKSLGYEKDIQKQNPSKTFSDLNPEDAKVVALGEALGIINKSADGKFNPENIETVNGALTNFLKYLKIPSNSNYDDAYELAQKNGLIVNTDFVIFKDKPVIRDNFVAMAYNTIMTERRDTMRAPIGEMLDRGIFKGEDLKNTGIPALAAFEYYNPVKLPPEVFTDKATGRKYYYINFNGRMALKPYVSSQNWNYEGTKFIFGCRVTNAMYEYDTIDNTVRILDLADCDGIHLYATVLPNNMIYYSKNGTLWKFDWKTGEKLKVGDRSFSIVSVTNDEKWASGDYGGSAANQVMGRLNLETGEFQEMHKDFKSHNPKSVGVNHSQINPGYPELQFFCNEGDTYMPDRMWLGNWDTGEMYNMFVQTPNSDGSTGEPVGHEIWGANGDYMYFVKFTGGSTVGQTGIVRTDRFGNNREYINGDYPYWHCSPSGDDNWVAADTNGGYIVLIDANSYQSHLLCVIRMYNWNHPYQPHPCISRNSAAVNWQMVNDDNICGIGWMNVSDISSNISQRENIEVNDTVQVISYNGTDCSAKKEIYNGAECIAASKRSKICFDIKDDFIYAEDCDVTVEVTYMDFGVLPLVVKYTSAAKSEYDLANVSNVQMNLSKTATKSWKTVKFKLKNANMANSGIHKSDFMMYSMFSNLIIKDVKIIKD